MSNGGKKEEEKNGKVREIKMEKERKRRKKKRKRKKREERNYEGKRVNK